jgi:hypothetical protein
MATSPIEAILRHAICDRAAVEKVDLMDFCDADEGPLPVDKGKIVTSRLGVGDCDQYGDDDGSLWQLFANVRALTYKIDLLLVGTDGAIAIECDGFEWHERTKQQAAADRARDRELLAVGLATIRFTGSEIHHYADRCAAEVYACARVEDHRDGEFLRGHEHGFGHGVTYALDHPCPMDVDIFTLLADHPSLIGTDEGDAAYHLIRDVRLRIAYDRAKRGRDLLTDDHSNWQSVPASVADIVAKHPFARYQRPRSTLRLLIEAAQRQASYLVWPERRIEEHW